MENNTPVYPSPPTNRHSIVSLILGILTVFFFCGSWVPVPFTSFISYPASFLSGLLALIYGIISLNGIRRKNEAGKPLAWIGILVGGFVLLCMLCAIVSIIVLFHYSPDKVQPFIQNYQF